MAEKTTKKKTTTKPVKSTAKATAAPTKKTPSTKKAVSTSQKKAPAKVEKSTPPKKMTAQTFEDTSVKVVLEQEAACAVSIQATLSSKVIEEATAQALKETSKGVSLPGFRKGKVPKSMIEKNYASTILEKKSQILVQKGLDLSIALCKLRPLNYRNVQPKVEKFSDNEAVFSYKFESYPLIPKIPLEKIKLEKIQPEEVNEKRVEEVIDVMRSYQAKWTPIEDRAIEMGDFVDIDVLNMETDTKLVSHKRVEVTKGKLSKWLIALLVGLKKDESKEGVSEWDDSLPTSEKKDFKATKCKAHVLGIFKGDLPPVDEDFAKAMGTQSVADLKTQVLLRLNKNAEADCERQQKALLDKALEQLVDFELPQTLIDAEVKTKLKLKQEAVGQKKLSKTEEAKMKDEAESEAKSALKLFFILQKLANDHGIIVSEQELREVLSERISQLNLPKEVASNQQYKNQLIQEMRMNCFIDLLTEKVKHHLLKQVTFA
ncbi:MAG: Trigger factor [Chlamydiae bacterium]|nr:Trigger factor [Chlamydiota bacterium]